MPVPWEELLAIMYTQIIKQQSHIPNVQKWRIRPKGLWILWVKITHNFCPTLFPNVKTGLKALFVNNTKTSFGH